MALEQEQTAQPIFTRVYADVLTEDLQVGIDDAAARSWDRYWAYYVMQRFAWSRFLNWWVSRRWIQPRDVRRQ